MDRVRAWVLVTAGGVALGCLVLLVGSDQEESVGRSLGWLGRWTLGVAVVAAVIVAAWGVWRGWAERRAAQRAAVLDSIASSAVGVVGRRPGGRTVRVTSWSRLRPRRIVVRYPKQHDPARSAGRLARAVGEVDRGATGRGWSARHDRLRHRFVLTPRPDVDEESRSREDAEDRAVRLVKKALPGCTRVTVTEWDEGQHPTRIHARFDPSPRLSSDRVQAAVVRVIGDSFPQRWVAEWDHEADEVEFHTRPELPRYVRRPVHLPTAAERLVLRYGVTEAGGVQGWDLDGTTPHALVIGPTGGGKTFCLRAMALDGISQGVTVYGLDPKRIELMGLIGVPGVAEIATDPEDMEALIVRMRTMMEQRYEQIEARQVTRTDLPPVLFILDEFFILRMRLNRLWVERGEKGKTNPVLDDVFEMLALARSARIHIVIGIQRPDAAFLDGPARDNVRHRAALTSVSPDGAQMTFGSPDIGTDLPDIAGRATAKSGGEEAHEVQVYVVPDPDPHLDGTRSPEDQELLDALLANAPESPQQSRPHAWPGPAAGDVPPQLVEGALDEVSPRSRVEQTAGPTAADAPVFSADDPAPAGAGEAPTGSEASAPSGPQVWDEVPAEELMSGETVRIEGEWVELVEADFDPLDEEYVALEWAGGALSLPAREALPRACAVGGEQAGLTATQLYSCAR